MTDETLAWLACVHDDLENEHDLEDLDRERLQDATRDEKLRIVAAALEQSDTPRNRQELRALFHVAIRFTTDDLYLCRERELLRQHSPKIQIAKILLGLRTAEERRGHLLEWERLHGRLAPLRHDRSQYLEERCLRWGFASQDDVRRKIAGPASGPSLEHYESAIVRPLDDRVHAWLRDQSFRDPDRSVHAGRWPRHLVDRLPTERIFEAIRDWHRSLRRMVGVQEADGQEVVRPVAGGPTSLATCLGAMGVALRKTFVGRQQSVANFYWGDPALLFGVQGLFRRLAVNPRWLSEYGIQVDAALAEGLLTGELLAPRILWAYVASAGSLDGGPTTEEIGMNWRRATGDGPTMEDRLLMESLHPPDLSRLRGLAYGLLMEESILSRFGRDWYRSTGAYRWLREIWDGETGQSAEQMADAAGIGTIDGSPIHDRSLQALDRGVRKQMESS